MAGGLWFAAGRGSAFGSRCERSKGVGDEENGVNLRFK